MCSLLTVIKLALPTGAYLTGPTCASIAQLERLCTYLVTTEGCNPPPPHTHTHDLADCNNEHSHLNPIIQSKLNVLIYSAFSLCLEIPGVNVTFLCIVPDFCSVLF